MRNVGRLRPECESLFDAGGQEPPEHNAMAGFIDGKGGQLRRGRQALSKTGVDWIVISSMGCLISASGVAGLIISAGKPFWWQQVVIGRLPCTEIAARTQTTLGSRLAGSRS